MALTLTVTPITVPTVTGDDYTGAAGTLPSVVKGEAFEIDIKFEYTDEMMVPWNITSIEPVLAFTEAITTVVNSNPLAYTIRLSGTVTDIFTDEYYRFLLASGSFVQQTSAPTEWEVITKWKTPSVKFQNVTHSFNIIANEGSLLTTVTQYIYWTFQSGVEYFQTLVSESK